MFRSDRRDVNPWIIAIAVMFGTFMEVLDTTVVNVSLPHIAGNLSATVDEAVWVLTSYLVANAIILPLTGWLANHFGRKRLLMASITGFTASSLLCGFAPNLALLVLFRVLQGICGGALQPLSQAIMLEAFPPERRGKAMGFWAVGIVVAPILGPVLGGWLTDNYSWRWIFYINIPVGVVSLVMTRLFIFDPPYIRRQSESIDYWGIGLLALGVGALQLVLDKGQQEDWFESRWIAWLTVISAAGLAAFVARELRAAHPVLDLRVLRLRSYSTGVFLMTVLGFVLYGSLVLLPIWLQTLLGYPALRAGIALAPRGMGSLLFMPIVGIITTRLDPRKLLGAGFVLGGVTLLQFSWLNLNAGYWDFFWPQFVQGAALSLLFVPLTTITMYPVPKEKTGNATSIFNFMRNLGGSMGIAMISTMMERRRQLHVALLSRHVTPYDAPARVLDQSLRGAMIGGGSDPASAGPQAIAVLWGMVQRQAALLSYIDLFRMLGVIFFLMTPLILLMKRPAKSSSAAALH